MMEKLAMSGYGAYVWSCYSLTFVIVLFLSWRGRLRHCLWLCAQLLYDRAAARHLAT